MSDPNPAEKPRKLSTMGKILAFLPLVAAIALFATFFLQMESGRDASFLPSALIGTKAPSLNLAPLKGANTPALTDAAIKGKLTLVNVWASWCVPCREEYPFIEALGKDPRLNLVGINYKDKSENALRFLGELGNPFKAIGIDPKGQSAINWGVYGIPETYLVAPDGTIIYKKVGPFDPKSIETELMPAIQKALAQKS